MIAKIKTQKNLTLKLKIRSLDRRDVPKRRETREVQMETLKSYRHTTTVKKQSKGIEENSYPVEEKVQFFFFSIRQENEFEIAKGTSNGKKKRSEAQQSRVFKYSCVCRRRRAIVKMDDGGQER